MGVALSPPPGRYAVAIVTKLIRLQRRHSHHLSLLLSRCRCRSGSHIDSRNERSRRVGRRDGLGWRGSNDGGLRGFLAFGRGLSGLGCAIGRGTVVLVDFEGVDGPESLFESFGIVPHEGIAVTPMSFGALTVVPFTSPFPAEACVEDNVVVTEVVVDVAVALEDGLRRVPPTGIGSTAGDIGRYLSARPEPDLDVLGGPLSCVNSAFSSIEPSPVGGRRRGTDRAALVFKLPGIVDIATGRDKFTGKAGIVPDTATSVGVQGHRV